MEAGFRILMKTFNLKSIVIAISFACLLSFSSAYANSQPALKIKLTDSTGIDSTQKANTVSLITDSSKIFTSLLAPSATNKTLDFPMSPEAKFFVDDYIKTHTTYLNNMKVWGKPYFDLY